MSAIETIQRSINEKSMVRYKKQSIDHFSASAIWAVYQKLNSANKEKYARICEQSLLKAASIAFQLVK